MDQEIEDKLSAIEAARAESERQIGEAIDNTSQAIATMQALVFAMIDCLRETPGYNEKLFHELLRQYRANLAGRTQQDLKTAQDSLLRKLKDFEGDPQ